MGALMLHSGNGLNLSWWKKDWGTSREEMERGHREVETSKAFLSSDRQIEKSQVEITTWQGVKFKCHKDEGKEYQRGLRKKRWDMVYSPPLRASRRGGLCAESWDWATNAELWGEKTLQVGRLLGPSGLESMPLGHGSARMTHHVFPVFHFCRATLPWKVNLPERRDNLVPSRLHTDEFNLKEILKHIEVK